MNERIEQLAKDQGLIHEFMTTGERNDALNKYKKFADALLSDVVEFVEYKFDFCGDEMFIADKIREHYGVDNNVWLD